MSRSSTYQDESHTYYNISILHDDTDPFGAPTQARFVEDRIQPLITNPSEYYMSIVRFSVPSTEIPIQVVPIIPFDNMSAVLPLMNNNPLKMPYSITLSYNGSNVQVFLEFTTDTVQLDTALAFMNPPLLTATNPERDNMNPYYNLTSYQNLINMFNTAITTAYNIGINSGAFAGSAPVVAQATAPYFILDDVTGLISLIADSTFNSNTANRIDMFLNIFSYNLFGPTFNYDFLGYNSLLGNGTTYKIIIENQGNNFLTTVDLPDIIGGPDWRSDITYQMNDYVEYLGIFYYSLTNNNTGNIPNVSPVQWKSYTNVTPVGVHTYLQMQQEFSSLFLWNAFRKIVFTSGLFPIKSEQIRSQNGNGDANFRNIITDFEVNLAGGTENRTNIQYFPQGPYRMVTMTGNIPLRKTDIQVWWEDAQQNLYPILIPVNQSVELKIMFRKATYTGS